MTKFISTPLWLILLLVSFSVAAAGAQEEELTQLEMTGFTMGPIQYKVIVPHYPDSVEPKEIQTQVQASLDRVNDLMSTYIPQSDVSRFNATDSTEFFEVDAETASVVARAIEISKLTQGAFDITVGPAVNLWKFGPDKKELVELPNDETIAKVKELIGYQKLEVQVSPPAIRKSVAGVSIDLSAIAKGYAVDQVAKSLDKIGCKQFMAEVGGEVVTRGQRAGGGNWRIGIERPNAAKTLAEVDNGKRKLSGVVGIESKAMATSGDYRNFFEHAGQRYSHTIDPKTCRPVEHGLASACIIADDCMTADALATAVLVLGKEQGKAVCDKAGVKFFLTERDSDFGDSLTEVVSAQFPFVEEGDAETPEAKKAETKSAGIWPAFLAASVIFGLAILGMALGSIFANKPVQGSCGGLSTVTDEDGESTCGVCSKPTTDCVEQAQT